MFFGCLVDLADLLVGRFVSVVDCLIGFSGACLTRIFAHWLVDWLVSKHLGCVVNCLVD